MVLHILRKLQSHNKNKYEKKEQKNLNSFFTFLKNLELLKSKIRGPLNEVNF